MSATLVDGARIVEIPGRGRGVVATRTLPAGTTLFTEYPLVAMQHGTNARAGVRVCEHCFRFLGPLEAQMNSLLLLRGGPTMPIGSLPAVPGMYELPQAVPCPGGCDLFFCSDACAAANLSSHHRLLCPGCGPKLISEPMTASSLEEDVQMMQIDDRAAAAVGSSSTASEGVESFEQLPTETSARFVAHAKATNEIFLMAAKAVAFVLCRLLDGGSSAYDAALAHFEAPPWWDAVLTPEDVKDEAGFRRTLRELLTESWSLLCELLAHHAPANCPLFATPDVYATIVGAFERRNCAVQVASPVEEYFLSIDAMMDGAEKAAVEAVTTPILNALDVAYSTPFEGTGLFPLQATLNHSCEPNVTLLKDEGEEERDGRVVARLTRDVAEGEELCNAYVDIALPVRRRRRELREYGFECDCARCMRELAAANEKKAAKAAKSEGKRRLK